jgi:hypothetical protein
VATLHELLNLGVRGTVTPPRNTKYAPGSGTRPSVAASGVKGKITPITTTSTVVTASGRLGRLRKGLPAIRMTKRTSLCRERLDEPTRLGQRLGGAEDLTEPPARFVGRQASA